MKTEKGVTLERKLMETREQRDNQLAFVVNAVSAVAAFIAMASWIQICGSRYFGYGFFISMVTLLLANIFSHAIKSCALRFYGAIIGIPMNIGNYFAVDFRFLNDYELSSYTRDSDRALDVEVINLYLTLTVNELHRYMDDKRIKLLFSASAELFPAGIDVAGLPARIYPRLCRATLKRIYAESDNGYVQLRFVAKLPYDGHKNLHELQHIISYWDLQRLIHMPCQTVTPLEDGGHLSEAKVSDGDEEYILDVGAIKSEYEFNLAGGEYAILNHCSISH